MTDLGLISLLAACLSYLQAGFVTSPYYGERELMYVFHTGSAGRL